MNARSVGNSCERETVHERVHGARSDTTPAVDIDDQFLIDLHLGTSPFPPVPSLLVLENERETATACGPEWDAMRQSYTVGYLYHSRLTKSIKQFSPLYTIVGDEVELRVSSSDKLMPRSTANVILLILFGNFLIGKSTVPIEKIRSTCTSMQCYDWNTFSPQAEEIWLYHTVFWSFMN